VNPVGRGGCGRYRGAGRRRCLLGRWRGGARPVSDRRLPAVAGCGGGVVRRAGSAASWAGRDGGGVSARGNDQGQRSETVGRGRICRGCGWRCGPFAIRRGELSGEEAGGGHVHGVLFLKRLFDRLGEKFCDFGDVCPPVLSDLLALSAACCGGGSLFGSRGVREREGWLVQGQHGRAGGAERASRRMCWELGSWSGCAAWPRGMKGGRVDASVQ
jgi:hypothetical protein